MSAGFSYMVFGCLRVKLRWATQSMMFLLNGHAPGYAIYSLYKGFRTTRIHDYSRRCNQSNLRAHSVDQLYEFHIFWPGSTSTHSGLLQKPHCFPLRLRCLCGPRSSYLDKFEPVPSGGPLRQCPSDSHVTEEIRLSLSRRLTVVK